MRNNNYSIYILPIFLYLSLSLPFLAEIWPTLYKEGIIIIGLLIFLLKNKYTIKINTPNKFIFLLIIVFFINFFFTQTYLQSTIIAIASCLACAALISACSEKQELIKDEYIYYTLIASSLTNFIIQLIQLKYIQIDGISMPSNGVRTYGNLGQPNHLGTLYAITIASLSIINIKNNKSTFPCIFLTILLSLGIFFTESRTAILSLVAIIIVSAFKKEIRASTLKIVTPGLFLIILLRYIFSSRELIDNSGGSGRIDAWITFLKSVTIHPFTGYGFGNTPAAQFDSIGFTQSIFSHTHNIFLDFLIWFGIPTGISLSLFFIYILTKTFDAKKISYLIIITPLIIHANLEFPLYYAYFLFLFCFFIGRAFKETPCDTLKNNTKYFLLAPATVVFLLLITEYPRIVQTQKIQAANILQNYKFPDQEKLECKILDELCSYTNILKDIKSFTSEDYETLEKLIKIHPTKFNFERIIKYSSQHNLKEKEKFYQEKYRMYYENHSR